MRNVSTMREPRSSISGVKRQVGDGKPPASSMQPGNFNERKEGVIKRIASFCFGLSGASRLPNPSRLASDTLSREPDHVHLSYHQDGSIKLRDTFIAYMSGTLSHGDCEVVEQHLRDPDHGRDRDHWDALFEAYEDEFVALALGDDMPTDAMLLTDRPDGVDIDHIRRHVQRHGSDSPDGERAVGTVGRCHSAQQEERLAHRGG